jgi:hypothetical protein
MFEAWGRALYTRRRLTLGIALVLVAVAAVWGTGVFGKLSSGNSFTPPASQSQREADQASRAFGRNDADVVVLRQTGRETMGRGQRGKRFRRTVAGIPTAVFRNRLTGQASRHRIRLLAVNPAYTSAWGDQHWRKPYENVTRHEAAATGPGCEEPNLARPAGLVRGYWAGQPLPRHWPAMAIFIRNGTVATAVRPGAAVRPHEE